MRKPCIRTLTALTLLLAGFSLVQAQNDPATGGSSSQRSVTDRLFLGFAEDAAFADKQWWEGQLEISNGDVVDANVLRGVVAFQPWKKVELGGRMGFGSTDTASGVPDGSGGTDLDIWGKYSLGSDSNDTDFAVGGMITVPTGDDTAGLGNDAFALAGFASLRYKLKKWTFALNGGLRFNGDAQILGSPEVDGETSGFLDVAGLIPVADKVTLVGELRYEGERFEFGDPDVQALIGLNWHTFEKGMIRAAASAGLDDGAPDARFLVGYAAEF